MTAYCPTPAPLTSPFVAFRRKKALQLSQVMASKLCPNALSPQTAHFSSVLPPPRDLPRPIDEADDTKLSGDSRPMLIPLLLTRGFGDPPAFGQMTESGEESGERLLLPPGDTEFEDTLSIISMSIWQKKKCKNYEKKVRREERMKQRLSGSTKKDQTDSSHNVFKVFHYSCPIVVMELPVLVSP